MLVMVLGRVAARVCSLGMALSHVWTWICISKLQVLGSGLSVSAWQLSALLSPGLHCSGSVRSESRLCPPAGTGV